MIAMLFLLIQLVILFVGATKLSSYSQIFYILSLLLSTVSIIYVINDKTNTSFKLAWIIPMLTMPVFGTLMYIFVKLELGTKLMNKRLLHLIDNTLPYLKQDEQTVEELKAEDKAEYNFAKYMLDLAKYPVYKGVYSEYLPLGEDKYAVMMEELRKAKKFIFLEYFIIERGYFWDNVLELLKEKVREGVEVRCVYDGTCTIALLPYDYPKKLAEFGIKCKVFSPIRPVLTSVQNNRDHRKILVIDGHTAFTGGINLADEYMNRRVRFGHWKDSSVMLKGVAVKSFTLMFLQNWNITETKEDDYCRYIPAELPDISQLDTSGYVIPYSDSPLDHENVGQNVYLNILYRAEKYVHIMTPYLILDDEMLVALTFAAKRGVETVILMPHIPDKQYAYLLARTYYASLIEAGVKIYEYTPGFVHSKVFVSDNKRAVVGSINLDYRSLFLHFECAAYIYGNSSINDIEADYLETLKKSELVTMENCRKYPLIKRVTGRVLRLIAPLM